MFSIDIINEKQSTWALFVSCLFFGLCAKNRFEGIRFPLLFLQLLYMAGDYPSTWGRLSTYSTVLYSTVQYSTVQYCTVPGTVLYVLTVRIIFKHHSSLSVVLLILGIPASMSNPPIYLNSTVSEENTTLHVIER
jgi:hypothetical protein